MTQIAFIGLGRMGAGMARNLVKAGHTVRGFDLDKSLVDAFAKAGGIGAASLEAAVTGADFAITMLPAGKHVEAVYTQKDGILSYGSPTTTLIDCSTIDIDTAKRVADIAAKAGYQMADAPVSGGVAAAEGGTLTFMVGGEETAFKRAEPILGAMGKKVVHAGANGMGQAAKICNNMVLGVSMVAICEAFNLADSVGLDRQKMFDIVSAASGQCWSLTSYCPVPGPVPASPANKDYQAGFMAALMLKDLNLSQEASASADVATPMGARARELYQQYCDAGKGEMDFSGIIQFLNSTAK